MLPKRFALAILTISAIALLGGVIWLVSYVNKPSSRPLQNLVPDSPECILPCIFSILPGETDYDDALQTMILMGAKQDGSEFTLKGHLPDLHVEIKRTDPRSGHYVSQVLVYKYPDPGQVGVINLGQMLDAGYAPVRVFRNRINGPGVVNLLVVFGKEQQILAHIVGYGQVNSESPIEYVVVLAKADQDWRMGDILAVEHWDYEIEWQGFASMDVYLNQETKAR
jgi:hypothetical protein